MAEAHSPVVYVVEHLDDELFPWSQCEYRSMIEYVKPQRVLFTNASFGVPLDWTSLDNFEVTNIPISKLGVPIEHICLLDSESPTLLSPEDAGNFSHFLLGGILGNTDEFDFDRTSVLRKQGFPTRNLGPVQMTTDTALRTTKCIVEDKKPFERIAFVDRPEIRARDNEQLILNFRFLADPEGKPIIAPGIVDLLLADEDEFDLDLLE